MIFSHRETLPSYYETVDSQCIYDTQLKKWKLELEQTLSADEDQVI